MAKGKKLSEFDPHTVQQFLGARLGIVEELQKRLEEYRSWENELRQALVSTVPKSLRYAHVPEAVGQLLLRGEALISINIDGTVYKDYAAVEAATKDLARAWKSQVSVKVVKSPDKYKNEAYISLGVAH